MKTITATVTEQNLIITPSVISVAESVGLYALKISYDEEWDEVDTKIITFTAPTGVSIAIQDTGAEEGVIIPWEVLQNPGKVTVGAVGYIGTTVKVTTTGLYKRNTFVVQPEAFGLQDAMTPTPDIYQTLIQTIDEINQSITSLQTNIDTVADDVAEVAEDVGDLGSLETENKDNLVDAINEVLEGAGGGAVNSVNGKTGVVVLNTSDLENTSDYQTGTEVSNAIGVETTAREGADANLQGQIDALSAASDVTDIVGTYANLQTYDTTKLKDNDIIKVLQDENQNDETTYYRWSTTTQSFTLIGEEGPYYTKSAADQKFQDKLTAGTNVTITGTTISATNTTYSDFTGTDGQTAGTAGLVPAPATTDDGKFLSAGGSWGTPTDTTYSAGAGLVLTGTVFSGDVTYRALNGASAPTTATEAKYVGQLYYDTTAGDMYYCSAITPQGTTPETYTYTWAQLGGGSSVTVVQTTGTSATDVMSQDATTKTIFGNGQTLTGSATAGTVVIDTANGKSYDANNSSIYILPKGGAPTGTSNYQKKSVYIGANASQGSTVEAVGVGVEARAGQNSTAVGCGATAGSTGVAIGNHASTVAGNGISIGYYANAVDSGIAIGSGGVQNATKTRAAGDRSVAIGRAAQAINRDSVALGSGAYTSRDGEINVGTSNQLAGRGYNSTDYRVIGGVHPAVDDHDATTLGQLNSRIVGSGTAAPTTSTVGSVGSLYAYVESGTGHLAICTDDTGGTYTWQTLI